MTKAEISLFADRIKRLFRRDRSCELLPRLLTLKDEILNAVGKLALLQMRACICKSVSRFKFDSLSRVMRSQSDGYPVGECLLSSRDDGHERLTRATIIAQLTGVARRKQLSRSAAILHVHIVHTQDIGVKSFLCTMAVQVLDIVDQTD
jgi:hypothetical protein